MTIVSENISLMENRVYSETNTIESTENWAPNGKFRAVSPKLHECNRPASEDYEFLFSFLIYFMPWEHAAKTSKDLLDKFGEFSDVISASRDQLSEHPFMTLSCVNMLKSLVTAALKLQRISLSKSPILANWNALIDYLQSQMGRDKVESVRVLLLNSKNSLMSDECLATGGPSEVSFSCSAVMRKILKMDATAFIIVHNHPSGDPTPSQSDIIMTSELVEASQTLGLTFHDHIIIGRGSYVSMKEMGYLSGM